MLVEIQKKIENRWMTVLTVPLDKLGDIFEHLQAMNPRDHYKLILEEQSHSNCTDCYKECANRPLES